MGEFRFELRVCRWAERHWPPGRNGGEDGTAVVVARQLGTKYRRWDTVVIECDPEGLRQRARFGRRAMDHELRPVVENAPAEWTWYRECLPEPDYPWRYVREAVNRAADRELIDRRKTGNRIEIRRRFEYPDWVERVVAIENKPDLDASAARDLTPQLEYDVAVSLADEVWLATRATGDRVEPALLEDLPVEAGVLAVADRPGGEDGSPAALRADAEVAWYPRSLSPADPGTRILDRPSGSDYDDSAARFEYVDPERKRSRRLTVAERAYERGWRAYADTMRTDCRWFQLTDEDGALLPYCDAKCRGQSAAECAGSCPEYQPEPPTWRTRGAPIEGGPGKLQSRLLSRRRGRRRPGLDGD
jgi:hypothetical protein